MITDKIDYIAFQTDAVLIETLDWLRRVSRDDSTDNIDSGLAAVRLAIAAELEARAGRP